MIGPVDVLAVMDDSVLSQPFREDRNDMREARAAVAELIAADKEYDNALVNVTTINREISERGWVALEYDALSQACTRLARAESRRMAAIAAVSP